MSQKVAIWPTLHSYIYPRKRQPLLFLSRSRELAAGQSRHPKKQAALVNKPHVFQDAIGQVENAEIEDEEQLFANELVVIEKENDGDTEFANE